MTPTQLDRMPKLLSIYIANALPRLALLRLIQIAGACIEKALLEFVRSLLCRAGELLEKCEGMCRPSH